MKIIHLKFLIDSCVICDECGVLFYGPDPDEKKHLCDRCRDLAVNIEKVSDRVITNHLKKHYPKLKEKILIAVTKMIDKRFKNLIK